jgi:hypothetical protein
MPAAGVLDPSIFVSHRLPAGLVRGGTDRFRRGAGRKILIAP